MNKKKFQDALQVLINVPALVEAIIGEKKISKIFKRLKRLPGGTEINVWLVLHNMIDPVNTVSTNITDEKERSLVIEEACRIYARMKSTPCKSVDALVEDAIQVAKIRKDRFYRGFVKYFQDGE